MKSIIEIKSIGKRYRIGAAKEPYLSLRDELAKPFRRLSSAFSRLSSRIQHSPFDIQHSEFTTETDFWALKDVSFKKGYTP